MAVIVEKTGPVCQGSVVDGVDWGLEENPLSIVLTNECDLQHDKASFIIVACLVEAKDTIKASKEYKNKTNPAPEGKLSNNQWKAVKELVEDYVHNKGICRYYYLDENKELETPAFLVDFQNLKSILLKDSEKLEVIGELLSPYKEQMMVHFASYTARIPSDRYEDAERIAEEYILPLTHK